MQIKSAMTEEQIRNENDPLFLTCHPLGKIKMISTLIHNESSMKKSIPFESYRSGEVYAMGEIIDDAADEIGFLVCVAQDQMNRLENRVRELEGRA